MSSIVLLLCVFATLGAIDIGYFHIYRFKLYRVPHSRGEQVTHLLRTTLFILAMSCALFVRADGPWSALLPSILAVDFLNSMIDVLLEPGSRAGMGGLPGGEYAVHMLTMFISGAILALAVQRSVLAWSEPAFVGLRLLQAPPAVLAAGVQVLVLSALFLLIETAAFVRALIRR